MLVTVVAVLAVFAAQSAVVAIIDQPVAVGTPVQPKEPSGKEPSGQEPSRLNAKVSVSDLRNASLGHIADPVSIMDELDDADACNRGRLLAGMSSKAGPWHRPFVTLLAVADVITLLGPVNALRVLRRSGQLSQKPGHALPASWAAERGLGKQGDAATVRLIVAALTVAVLLRAALYAERQADLDSSPLAALAILAYGALALVVVVVGWAYEMRIVQSASQLESLGRCRLTEGELLKARAELEASRVEGGQLSGMMRGLEALLDQEVSDTL